jgi:hypothetical protein
MMNIKKRLILMIVYWVASVLVFGFIYHEGAAIAPAFNILASWGMVLSYSIPLDSSYMSFVFFLVYLMLLFTITTVLTRYCPLARLVIPAGNDFGVPILSLIIHGIGSVIAFNLSTGFPILLPQELLSLRGLSFVAMIIGLPIIMVLLYLAFDWRLARRSYLH